MQMPSASLIHDNGTFDIPAIRREIQNRFAVRLNFIDSYTGEARRYWSRLIRKQVIKQVCAIARDQENAFVFARVTVIYTPEEFARMQELRWASPMSVSDAELYSPEYRDARAETDRIRRAAYARSAAAFRYAIRHDKQARAA
jgi:hypothetical protein